MTDEKPRIVPGRPKRDGTRRWYYYVTRSGGTSFWTSEGPRPLDGPPWPRAFRTAWADAKKAPEPETFGALCQSFIASLTRGTKKRAASTVSGYKADVEAILEMPMRAGRKAKGAPIAAFNTPKATPYIAAWHESMADKPRTADMRLATLGRILNHGQAKGLLSLNAAEKIPKIYERPVGEHVPVEEAEFLRFVGDGCPRGLAEAAWMARLTGMRRADLASAPASCVLPKHLRWRTSKGRRKQRVAIYPITEAVRTLLVSIARRRADLATDAPTLLFNERGNPWAPSSLDTALKRRREAVGAPNIAWHALRRMAVTDLLVTHVGDPALVTRAMLKDAFGWTEADLDQMLRTYADEEAVADAITGNSVSASSLPH